ncbi:MAG: ATP-binding protein, partial [Bacteroidetes bacterium]
EKGKLELKRETIALSEVLTPLLESTRIQLESQGGQLRFTGDDPADVYLSADPLHLSNILYSLLDNAIKYSPDSANITVVLQVNAQRQISLSVQDEGIGIDPAYQARVFDKFYRIPTGNIHNVKGFGLGLFYVQRICQAHGWGIHLDSEPGRGTTISLQLGQARKQNSPAPILSPSAG